MHQSYILLIWQDTAKKMHTVKRREESGDQRPTDQLSRTGLSNSNQMTPPEGHISEKKKESLKKKEKK